MQEVLSVRGRAVKRTVLNGAMVLSLALGLVWAGGLAAEMEEKLLPIADTYVHQEEPQQAYGGEDYLEVGSQQDANRRAFLRFDLGKVPGDVAMATLNLYFYWGSGFVALRNDDVRIEARAVDDEAWDEETLTWDSVPQVGKPKAHASIGASGRWIALDITDYARARAAEDHALSVAVCFSHEDYDTSDRRIRFRSTEYGDAEQWPYLEVEYEPEEDPTPAYTLAVRASPPEGGTVEVDGVQASLPYEGEYPENTSVVLRAASASGWEFVGWEVGDEEILPAEQAITVHMDEDTQVCALFESGKHTITATAGPGGTISPAGEVTVAPGELQLFTIAPEEGAEISDVVVDGSSVVEELAWENGEASYTFAEVTSDHIIHATFQPLAEVTLTVEVLGPGWVEVDGVPYTDPTGVPPGTEVELTARAEEGGAFARWHDGCKDATRTIVLTEDATVRAYFRTQPHCLAVGPHPVPREGAVWWLSLPQNAVAATLHIFAVDGALVSSIELDPRAQRHPAAGRWQPHDARGRLLGTGLYLCVVKVRHEDGRISHCPVARVVIDR